MNKDLNIDIDEIKNEIETLKNEEINEELFIEVYKAKSLTSESTTNSSKLANILDDKGTYQLTKQGGNIFFNEAVYVNSLSFEPENKGIFELTYTTPFNKKITLKRDTPLTDNRIYFLIREVATSFSLKFEQKPLSFTKKSIIKNLRIFALNQNDFSSEIQYLKNVSSDRSAYEEKINNLKLQLENHVEHIQEKYNEYENFLNEKEEYETELINTTSKLKNEKTTLQKNIDQQNIDIESLNSQIAAKENQLGKLENDFIELTKRSKLLTDGNDRLENKQKELEKKVNLFPDTLEGFIQRASNTKLTYGILAFIPLCILAFLINLSWDTLKGFTTTTTLTSFESAWIVLIQRIPFTLLVITLASMCIAFLYKMVRHLTEVQQQELNLAKISMLAKDVADSEYSHLDENALHKLRAEKKIKLIREFLNSEFNRYQQFVEKEETQKVNYSLLNTLPFKNVPFLNKVLNTENKKE